MLLKFQFLKCSCNTQLRHIFDNGDLSTLCNLNISCNILAYSFIIFLLQIEEFKKFASDSDAYQNICSKIAPSIFGHDDVKKAVACLLFGGSRKFLKFVERTAPIAVYTSGKGSSTAGLTASFVVSLETFSVSLDANKSDLQIQFPLTQREFYLEGGAMVLADGGVVCIDEFDKMRPEDKQTISIAKAGITTVLNSRTSVLAAANPPSGRYDDLKTAQDNIDLQTTMLSRFDLIFIVKDIRLYSQDKYFFWGCHVANDKHVDEAIRLFNNATMDAARSGINQHINRTPEMAKEIMQAETQIKRRMGIGSHLSERRLIDELGRMGMNESIEISPVYLSRSHSLIDTASSSRSLLDAAARIFLNAAAAQGPRRRQISSLNTLKTSLNQDTHFDSQETCFSNWTLFRKHLKSNVIQERVNCAAIPPVRDFYFLCKGQKGFVPQSQFEQANQDTLKIHCYGIVVRGQAYGVRTIRVNGNDALAMFSAVEAARLRSLCRSGMIGGNQIGHGINRFCGAGGREGRVQLVLKKRDCEFNEYRVFVTDGACRAGAEGGAAAWVLLNGTGQEVGWSSDRFATRLQQQWWRFVQGC
ncbi:hypothetical protein RHGRI_034150 [Rhododendron griersonianum]|uniref:DNA helicase n=1 Tax=Rhododendron griersonianum TaxID=479676 RepID=A0AAV6HZW6_9ERIC|nr:hypothetical protein RHGRI_034150 [Rhododendron griersonianum]